MSRDSATITRGAIIQALRKTDSTGLASQAYNEMIENMDYSELLDLLQEFARNGHRSLGGRHYTRDTDLLHDNTYAKQFSNEHIAVGYDSSKVVHRGYEYGEFIRKGRDGNSWEGDDFIEETISESGNLIQWAMQRSIDKAVVESNSKSSIVGSFIGTVKRWFK